MANNVKVVSTLSLGVLVLTLFVGCDLFKKKEEAKAKEEVAGASLLSIGGKSVLNEGDFNKHLTRMIQMNPYFRGAGLDSLPLPLKRKVFDELVKQELIVAEAYKNKIDEKEEFQKSLKEMMELVKKSLLVQQFEKDLLDGIKIEESEIKDDFEKNKEKYLKDSGGVLVSAIKFDSDLKAVAFLNKVKADLANFVELAKKENSKNFTDFGRVSDGMGRGGMPTANVPSEIKKKVLAIAKFPAVEKVTSGKDFWVVYASDKKDKEFFAIDEIKPQLEAMLKNNKFRSVLEAKLKDLEKAFAPEVNEKYFQVQAPQSEKPQDGAEGEGAEVEVEAPAHAAPGTSA